MKKIFVFLIFILFVSLTPLSAQAEEFLKNISGYILLQVEESGEAWYVYPSNGERYYLGRPEQAFEIMQKLSLGAKHDFIINTEIFPERLAGIILLDVEANGEAYYIYPRDLKKYYLGRPADAFRIMQNLGLGITNKDLTYVPIGDLERKTESFSSAKILISNVPFTSQAPFGDWGDQRQQDGCEEASALMAVKWARNESLTSAESLAAILESSDYTQKQYGEYRDVSLADTIAWVIKDYFNFNQVALKRGITIQGIIDELNQNHLVLVQMNGQLLYNPHFTPPGPERHMLVVRGYDAEKKIFITNDPGTRHGELYKYDYDIFYNAIRDYPTGYHEPIENISKSAIIIWK